MKHIRVITTSSVPPGSLAMIVDPLGLPNVVDPSLPSLMATSMALCTIDAEEIKLPEPEPPKKIQMDFPRLQRKDAPWKY